MDNLRESNSATLLAMLTPICEGLAFDYLFEDALALLKEQRERLARDRRALKEWIRAEPCLGVQRLDPMDPHEACDYCNGGGMRPVDHILVMQERAVTMEPLAREIIDRRGWSARELWTT